MRLGRARVPAPPGTWRAYLREDRRGEVDRTFVVVLTVFSLFAGLVILGAAEGLAHVHLNLGPGSVDLPGPSPPSSHGMDIALSPDGRIAYVTEPSSDSLAVLDLATGRLVATVPAGRTPTGLAVSPDGATVWVADTDVADSVSEALQAPGNAAAAVAQISSVGVRFDGIAGVAPLGVATSADGSRVFVTEPASLTSGRGVTVLAAATGIVVATWPPGNAVGTAGPTSVVVGADGRVWTSDVDVVSQVFSRTFDSTAAAPTSGSSVSVDAPDGTVLATIGVGDDAYFMALSRDGRFAYVADKGSCDVEQIDTTTYRVTRTITWPTSSGCPYGIAVSPTDDEVADAVTGTDDTFHVGVAGDDLGVADFATGRLRLVPDVGVDPVTLALSPQGTTAYVVDADAPDVVVVDLTTGQVERLLSLGPLPVPARRPR